MCLLVAAPAERASAGTATLSAVAALEGPEEALAASEFELRVGGEPAEVVAAERLAADGRAWRVLVYFDTPLLAPASLAGSIRLLSESAERLTALGPVTIVAAEPEPRQLLSAARHAHEVRETLKLFGDRTTLAGELLWRRLRFLEARRASRVGERDAREELERERRLLERQLAALSGSLWRRPEDRPGLLILVQDGFDLDFKHFYLDSTARLKGLENDVRETHAVLGRTAAAAGWTVLGLSLGEPGSEFASPREPLRILADATGGEVVLDGRALDEALEAAGRRVRLTYRAALEEGRVETLELGFRSRPISGPRWAGRLGPAAAAPATRASREASTSAVRLLSPGAGPHVGATRVTAITGEHDVAYVAFFLDGFLVDVAHGAPFQTRLALGAEPALHTVEAAAFSRDAIELGRDTLRLNEADRPFRVEISEVVGDPRRGRVDLRAETSTPIGRRLERLDVYWNQELKLSFSEPPLPSSITATIETGPAEATDHYRVVAHLDDGTSLESARMALEPGVADRLDVNLVELYAMVTDRRRAPLDELTREDFKLFHGGRSRRIEGFARAEDVPLTLGLAVDTSESMEAWQDDIREAAAAFFESALGERDRAFLTDFDERARLTQGPTRRRELLVGRMGALEFGGTTALYDAILFSLTQFEGESGRKALVVLSDGKDSGSRFRPERCIREALRLGVPLYMVVLESSLDTLDAIERLVLERLARRTGGRFHTFTTRGGLAAIYEAIDADLHSQYLLTYAMERPLTAADLSDIRVEVSDPKLSVRTVLGSSLR